MSLNLNLIIIRRVKIIWWNNYKKLYNEIIKTKKHLTSPSVFNKIIEIKSGMNLNRKF